MSLNSNVSWWVTRQGHQTVEAYSEMGLESEQ